MKFSFFSNVILIFFLLTNILVKADTLSFEEIKIIPHDDNELRAIASVKLNDTANVFFKYRDTDTTAYLYSAVSNQSKNHTITLTTLKESSIYQIEVIAFNKNNFIKLDTITYQTTYIDERIKNFEDPINNNFYTTEQYTVINIPSGREAFFIVCDLSGYVVWYHKYMLDFNSCNAWRITAHNTILYANCKEIVELDFLGNVLRRIETDEPDWYFHHDVQYLSNGDIAVIYAQPEKVIVSSGREEVVIVDGYLIINQQNEIVHNWKASDFFDASVATPMGGYWSQVFGYLTLDWCHFNSIAEDFDNNILISASHWSKVFKVNKQSGEVIWQLGEEGTLAKDSTFRIHRQHSLEPVAPHKYLLFDNLGNSSASRALEFAVDPDTNFAFPYWQYEPPEKITSPTRGNIQRLSNGNTLVFFPTNRGQIHEVTPEGQLAWKINLIRSGYRAYRIPYLTAPHSDVSIEINDTICSSKDSIDIITQPVNAYLSGTNIIDGQFVTDGFEGTTQTIKAVYGNNSIEKNVFIANKEYVTIQLNDTLLQIPETYQAYQWYYEGMLINNETYSTLVPEKDGQYFVSFENRYGCINYSDTIDYIKTNILTIDDKTSFKVITNNNTIQIISDNNTSKKIDLYTLDGKLLFSNATSDLVHKIPLKDYSGMLILKIQNNKKNYTKKIVL